MDGICFGALDSMILSLVLGFSFLISFLVDISRSSLIIINGYRKYKVFFDKLYLEGLLFISD